MAVERVAVIGAGLMGSGITQVVASSGLQVTMRDVEQSFIDRGMEGIRGSLARFVKSGRMEQARADEIAGGIRTTTSIEEAVSHADYVFEAVPEILELKQEVFVELDRLAPPHAILATNTSQLSVTSIGAKTKRQDKVIGAHWFNPAPVMKLIEIIRALDTSDETVQVTLDLCRSFGKETVLCNKDSQGFIVNRMLLAQRAEAYRMLEEGVATVEEMDRAIELGLNHPMGPFKLADLTGLDTGLHNLEYMTEAYGDRFRPTATIKNMVNAGHLGRKTGRGWYPYESGSG
ncbi:MAG TPA: 3-hydroxyacyl-CoA dehydrogenase family protein [Chloroflexota bacterium]|nr:3-hydroxyacyl-CoA dehydrogenase family protein [Chloroflexota bacterium]